MKIRVIRGQKSFVFPGVGTLFAPLTPEQSLGLIGPAKAEEDLRVSLPHNPAA